MNTTYTKRDLRAADMLAMIFVGLGVLIAFGLACPLDAPGVGKAAKASASGFGSWLVVMALLSLGTALNMKVRQLIRSGGREPDDHGSVPE